MAPLCPPSAQPPGPCRPHLWSVLSPRAPEATGTMLRVLVGAVLPVMVLAAPPPINKLALFPDKSAWCEAKNITQIVGHSGCEAKSIQNRWDPGGRQLGGVRTGAPRGGRGCLQRLGPRSLPSQGLPGTVLQLQRPQHLPAVDGVPGALRLLHAGPVHVGDCECSPPRPGLPRAWAPRGAGFGAGAGGTGMVVHTSDSRTCRIGALSEAWF